jgi:hypothetical protein
MWSRDDVDIIGTGVPAAQIRVQISAGARNLFILRKVSRPATLPAHPHINA